MDGHDDDPHDGGAVAVSAASVWRLRWFAAGLVALQFVLYVPPEGVDVPFPRLPVGLGFVATITVVNLVSRRWAARADPALRTRIAVGELVADSVVVFGLVLSFSFDPTSALWALLILPILEGAMRAQLRGALVTWAGLSIAYVLRELWAAQTFDTVVLLPDSITYRLGIVLLVAVATGSLAEALQRQVDVRDRTASRASSLRRFGLQLSGTTDRATICATTIEAARTITGGLASGGSWPPVPAPAVGVHLFDGPLRELASAGRPGRAVGDGPDGSIPRVLLDLLDRSPEDHRTVVVPPEVRAELDVVAADAEVVVFAPVVVADAVRAGVLVWSGPVQVDELCADLDALALQVGLTLESAVLAEQLARQEGEARFRALVQHAADVITVVDPDGTVSFQSPSAERAFGYPVESVTGTAVLARVHPDDLDSVTQFLRALVAEPGSSGAIEFRLRHADGSWRHVEATGENLVDDPHIAGLLFTSRDASRRKELELQLTHQAFHDDLTGLANRALFSDRVSHALLRSNRTAGGLAVLFCDLDDFKTVNDSLGHQAGDQLLAEVAARLRRTLRPSDTVARIGGDEFAVLLEDADSAQGAVRATERIIGALTPPFTLGGREVLVRASIGIAVADAGIDSADELLRNADLAMYTAKGRGKGCYALFEPAMHSVVVTRHTMAADLRTAMANDELALAYQPIVDLGTNTIVGIEALARWRSPEHGAVAPARFIPLAEETGLIVPVGEWVLREACRQVRRWRDIPGTNGIYAAINVSGRQFREPALIERVARHLDESGLEPRCLVIEITESVLMDDHEATIARLGALRDLGVRLAIDDFGTGYSSLSYLQRFPVDILKIDKTFVDAVSTPSGCALAASIIDLGHALGLTIVGEGVEAEAQVGALNDLGCDCAQGFLFAEPMAGAAVVDLLDRSTVDLRDRLRTSPP